MRLFRSARWLLLALLLSIVPATSFAGVFISVNFGPPVLPVYEQPPCPEPNWIWMPGYWAYGEDGYFWVPGAWVEAPYEGALWTPGYWGWQDGLYVWHEGYWGKHVGYYGGVNYGFGYMGIGFVGGMWRGHDFVYNTAVMRVDERRIHNTFMDREIVRRNMIVNDRRVAFSGGPGGIHHDPRPDERIAEREQHMDRSAFQQQHENAARSDRDFYYKNNGGRPSTLAVQRPMIPDSRNAQPMRNNPQPGTRMEPNWRNGETRSGEELRQNQQNRMPQDQPRTWPGAQQQPQNQQQAPQYQHQMNPGNPQMQQRPGANVPQPAAPPQQTQQQQQRLNQPQVVPQQQRTAPQQNAVPQQQQRYTPAPQNTVPQQHVAPQQQVAPQQHAAPQQAAPQQHAAPQKQDAPKGESKGESKDDKDHKK